MHISNLVLLCITVLCFAMYLILCNMLVATSGPLLLHQINELSFTKCVILVIVCMAFYLLLVTSVMICGGVLIDLFCHSATAFFKRNHLSINYCLFKEL